MKPSMVLLQDERKKRHCCYAINISEVAISFCAKSPAFLLVDCQGKSALQFIRHTVIINP